MILTPHAIVGASISSAFRLTPFTALVAGFVSHFVLDMIPHFDYRLRSAKIEVSKTLDGDLIIGRPFFQDLAVMGVDCLLGLGLSWLFFSFAGGVPSSVILAGALGGVLPDALQFAYYKIDRRRLRVLQAFHMRVHTSLRIKDPVKGFFWYSIIIVLALLLGNWRFFFWVA